MKAVFLLLAVSASARELWEPISTLETSEDSSDAPSSEFSSGDDADLEKRRNRKPRGQSYCTWSPDYKCYKSGWPQCCADDPNRCPKKQPLCDRNRRPGSSYCTYAPDYECYKNGWPRCCKRDPDNCPKEQPSCDKNEVEDELNQSKMIKDWGELDLEDVIDISVAKKQNRYGSSYCTYAPDYKCYKGGWPQCCADDPSSCPKMQPVCDKNTRPGSSYCTYAPDYTCYVNGWPKCCKNNPSNCPKQQPSCDKGVGKTEEGLMSSLRGRMM